MCVCVCVCVSVRERERERVREREYASACARISVNLFQSVFFKPVLKSIQINFYFFIMSGCCTRVFLTIRTKFSK